MAQDMACERVTGRVGLVTWAFVAHQPDFLANLRKESAQQMMPVVVLESGNPVVDEDACD